MNDKHCKLIDYYCKANSSVPHKNTDFLATCLIANDVWNENQ